MYFPQFSFLKHTVMACLRYSQSPGRIFRTTPNASSRKMQIHTTIFCTCPRQKRPVFRYPQNAGRKNATSTGLSSKIIGFAANAAEISSRSSAAHICVTPQPGHLKPVTRRMGQGIPIPVRRKNHPYKSPAHKNKNRIPAALKTRLFILVCHLVQFVLHQCPCHNRYEQAQNQIKYSAVA